MLEKRKNDARTEGEFISKIFDRNIDNEYINFVKKELKKHLQSLTEGAEVPQLFEPTVGQLSSTKREIYYVFSNCNQIHIL